MLDSRIRNGLKLTDLLRGAVVIIDEAHNVEETARESGSADLGSAALREAHTLFAGLADIVRQGCSCCHDMGHDSSSRSNCSVAAKIATRRRARLTPADLVLGALLSELLPCGGPVEPGQRLAGAAADAIPGGSDDLACGRRPARTLLAGPGRRRGGWRRSGRGTAAGVPTAEAGRSELLGTLGVGDESYRQWEVGMKAAEIVVGHLSAMQQGQPPHHVLQGAPHHFIFEQVALLCHRPTSSTPPGVHHVVLKQRTGLSPVAAPRFEYELGLWLLKASVITKPLSALCKSLVFASGTLEPLDRVVAECGLNVTAQTKLAVKEHVVKREQMWLGAVWKAGGGGRPIKVVKRFPTGPHYPAARAAVLRARATGGSMTPS